MRILDLFTKKARLYNSCSDIPIWNFDIAKKTRDLRYLVVGYDGYKDVKLPDGAEERFKELVDEWIKLIDNNEIAYYYDLMSEVMYLETRYEVSKMLLHQIYTRNMGKKTLEMYIEMLKEWNYHYNSDNDKLEEIHRLMQQHKASKNKLGLKKDELIKLNQDNSEEPKSLERQAVVLEQITGKNNIDVRTTSVTKWVEITKLAHDINEQRQKNGRK